MIYLWLNEFNNHTMKKQDLYVNSKMIVQKSVWYLFHDDRNIFIAVDIILRRYFKWNCKWEYIRLQPNMKGGHTKALHQGKYVFNVSIVSRGTIKMGVSINMLKHHLDIEVRLVLAYIILLLRKRYLCVLSAF